MAIKENDFIDILKLIAPGTAIREGLDNILKEKTGGFRKGRPPDYYV